MAQSIDETITTAPIERPNEPTWLAIARAELGVHEAPGADNDARVSEYFSFTRLGPGTPDSTAWCAAFVGWCLERAGIRSTKSARARSYLTWGFEIREPRIGCIVVLSRGDAALGQGHVGLYVGARRKGLIGPKQLLLLGGNQANAVSIAPYAYQRVISYRWPVAPQA
jgi:uncharacterized protein (TIGR02594 family)